MKIIIELDTKSVTLTIRRGKKSKTSKLSPAALKAFRILANAALAA